MLYCIARIFVICDYIEVCVASDAVDVKLCVCAPIQTSSNNGGAREGKIAGAAGIRTLRRNVDVNRVE